MDTPTCNIPKNSDLAALLRQTKVIVWDECTMMNRKGYEALDRSLRDVCSKDVLFGGITVLLAGDFCQTLPVIPKGTPADEIKVLFKTKQLLFSQ
jgi:ATP-dependent DNA helicase PIF1